MNQFQQHQKHDVLPEIPFTIPIISDMKDITNFSFGSFTAPPNTSVNIIENPEDDSLEPASPHQVPTETLEIELEKPVEDKHIEDIADDKLGEEKNVEDSLEDATCVRIRPVDFENIKTKRRGTKPAPPGITDTTALTTTVKQPAKPTDFTLPPPKPTAAPKKKNKLIATYKAGPKKK